MTKKAKKSGRSAEEEEEEADAAAGNLGSFDDDDLVGVGHLHRGDTTSDNFHSFVECCFVYCFTCVIFLISYAF